MTMTLRQRMRDLKETLQSEDDFSIISQKFFDMAHMKEFMALSKDRDSDFIEKLIEHTIIKVLGEDKAFLLKLAYIKKFGFYHGSLIVEGLPGTVFYFESIRMGMIALSLSLTGEMSFSRFSGDIVKEGSFTAKHSDESH